MPVAGAVLLGASGFLGGAFVGFGIDAGVRGSGCQETCGWAGAALGALVGETAGVAVGAHVGNGERGSLAADLGVSLGAALLGAVIIGRVASTCHGCAGAPVLAAVVPLAQVIGVVLTERATARAKP